MNCSWEEINLGDIAQDRYGLVDGPFGSNLPASCYTDDGIPVIRGSNLSLGLERFRDHDFVFVSDETLSRLSRSECLPGDIVFTKKGTLGQTGIVPRNGKYSRYLLSSNQMRLRVDAEVADENFVYLFVSSFHSIQKIKLDSEHTGVPKINLEYIKNFPICLPRLREQQKIAEVLLSLEEKIELNRKQNRTLEAIAQALFKRWFVELEFPDENGRPYKSSGGAMQPSELGEIPVGWEVKPLSQLINLIGGGTPKTSVAEYWGGNIPWFSVVDAPNGSDTFVIDTEKKITQAGIDNSSAKLLHAGTTIVSARGTVGRLALVGVDMAMNQSCYGVQGRIEGADFFTYLTLQRALGELRANAHGSVFDTITRATFENLMVVHPDKYVILECERVIAPLFQKLLSNVRQSVSLTRLRDTLLPKLMSGELRVGDAA